MKRPRFHEKGRERRPASSSSAVRPPSVLNMPDRAAYDALSNEQQRRGIDCTLPFFYGPATLWMGLGSWACCPPKRQSSSWPS